ncbi:RNA polymerase sigma factor [Anaerosalibacter massiliensis]|uniref:Sigma-70 family RNA polymerase sigma factor n=1 Tax=Anaerosalibacter massiliensis TaxID=1347392 RepID=A0A9X2MJF7_9FIRM|nr:sigma-70 family RNA polymerase sigma factor [Anaerosalibacter massiliensis]MCR2045153.1 sigma-70 family RNA polymerase sigma factor [Anaerosalibacter massiliensis]
MDVYKVYKKYNKDFIAFAKSITDSEDPAFDLVQEAYVAALEREEIFNRMNEYQIKGWFFTTIKNKNIDNIRKRNRFRYIENIELFEATENFEENIHMKGILEDLPEKNKKVLLLKYGMNLNSKEIGEILGIPSSTVRSRLSAGLKILRKNL